MEYIQAKYVKTIDCPNNTIIVIQNFDKIE